jgi:hypothetical protein
MRALSIFVSFVYLFSFICRAITLHFIFICLSIFYRSFVEQSLNFCCFLLPSFPLICSALYVLVLFIFSFFLSLERTRMHCSKFFLFWLNKNQFYFYLPATKKHLLHFWKCHSEFLIKTIQVFGKEHFAFCWYWSFSICKEEMEKFCGCVRLQVNEQRAVVI